MANIELPSHWIDPRNGDELMSAEMFLLIQRIETADRFGVLKTLIDNYQAAAVMHFDNESLFSSKEAQELIEKSNRNELAPSGLIAAFARQVQAIIDTDKKENSI